MLSKFISDAVARHNDGDSDWLRARRSAAAEALADAELPTTDEEVWRYSRIDELELDRFTPALGGAEVSPLADTFGAGAVVVVGNGRIVDVQVDAGWSSKGVRIGRLDDRDEDEALLGSALHEAPDPFTLLNAAGMADPILVQVPEGVELDRPVLVAHTVAGHGSAAFPRLVVHAGPGSAVSVIEVQASDEEPTLVVPITEIVAERAARVGHVTLQQLGLATWQVGLQASRLESESTLRSTSVGFGGEYARLRTDCRMVGRGASGELDAIYFGEGDQTLDFRTFQEHVAPDCTSNLLYKGAVGGRSRSVYTGLIRVGKDARGTNAFQTNRNIKLSDEAWAESVPNLVIENNDVRCSHASAVGPIDEDQRFYLESRGLPTDLAERLIVGGFFAEVLAKLPVAGLVPVLAATIAAKFDRREA
ncbi:MAG TPA: Fe-S cluster assembly protein SufD [Acidimicrobiales bacterium]|jgi:Fe-S cluster assembly protein SufD